MKRLLTLVAAAACAGGLLAAAPKTTDKAARDYQDIVFLGDARPVLIRVHVELDGRPTLPAEVELEASGGGLSRLRLVIREGRYRQVRRMLEAVDHYEDSEMSPAQLAALRLADAYLTSPADMSDAVRKEIADHLTPVQIVELVLKLTGYSSDKTMVALGLDLDEVSPFTMG